MGQQVNIYKELKFFPGAVISGMPGQGEGRTYYVNNITGSTTADGLSWNSAVSQPSRAITLSKAYRELGGRKSSVDTNDYIRNTIIIQGTGTAYSAISALPSYCDVIGLGADPYGNGGGIARLSASSGDTAASTGVRGLNMYNMQFTGSGAGYAMDLAVIYRSKFEHCVFVNRSTGGMRIVTGGGVIIDDCLFGGDTIETGYGLYIGSDASSGNFNSCKISNSTFHGSTAACYNSGYWQNQTVFTNNVFQGGTYGMRDNALNTDGVQYLAFYVKNFCYGSASVNANDGGMKINILPNFRCIGNWCSDHGDGHMFVELV